MVLDRTDSHKRNVHYIILYYTCKCHSTRPLKFSHPKGSTVAGNF